MTSQEKGFLVNYLGNREKKWGIHDEVKKRFSPFSKNMGELISEGYIIDEPDRYTLTPSGKVLSEDFKSSEKIRKKEARRQIMSLAMERDYLGAYNARAKYELGCVMPHGISASMGSSGNSLPWKLESHTPFSVLAYVKWARLLDFSDCNNSEVFKSDLRAFYIGTEIAGSGDILLPDDFEDLRGEYLDCPSLEKQLKEKCLFKKIPKLKIYFRTKVSVLNSVSTGLIESWDGKFQLGIYDCTNPYHFDMAEFDVYSDLGIASFPKTFNTFFKHKKANSEKYQTWMKEIGDRRLLPIVIHEGN